MAQLGGWGQLGGTFKLGGSQSRGQVYYGVLKAMGPPGLRPNNDDTTTNRILRMVAMGLGHGDIHVHRREEEFFPESAVELLAEWESFLNVVPSATATIAERQAAIYSRWRGLQAPSLPVLRDLFYPVLSPETAMLDIFPGSGEVFALPLWRYRQEGNGTQAVSGGLYTATVTSPTQADFPNENANMLLYRLHDLEDGFTYDLEVNAGGTTVNAGTSAGIILFSDWSNHLSLAFFNDGSAKIGAFPVFAGRTDAIVSTATALTKWLRIVKDKTTGAISCYYGNSRSSLTLLATIQPPFPPLRYVGAAVSNGNPWNTVSLAAAQHYLIHETDVNNVEIVETKKAARDAESAPEHVFTGFVMREPTDGGTYNIKEAQQLADRRKHAHKLLLVGESDYFLCDDGYSLCDRDILGE